MLISINFSDRLWGHHMSKALTPPYSANFGHYK